MFLFIEFNFLNPAISNQHLLPMDTCPSANYSSITENTFLASPMPAFLFRSISKHKTAPQVPQAFTTSGFPFPNWAIGHDNIPFNLPHKC